MCYVRTTYGDLVEKKNKNLIPDQLDDLEITLVVTNRVDTPQFFFAKQI